MTDLLNIAKECGAIFEGQCQACGGSGVIMETITVPVCCGRFSPHGDCCGNPDPAQEYQPAQCGCGGITFIHLSTDQLHATVEKVCAERIGGDLSEWLKDGETVLQRLERERTDLGNTIMSLSKVMSQRDKMKKVLIDVLDYIDLPDSERFSTPSAKKIREIIAEIKDLT